MKSTFSLLLSSLLLTSSLSFAAPSQLVFGDKSLTSSSPSRDPDFVDILESQSSFNDKLQELLQDAQELSKEVITESYSKVADLSNQAEIEALLIAASLEDKVMEILPLPQDGDHHDQNGITKGLKSGLNHSKKPLKNDVSIPDLPNWGAFKNLNADTQLDAPSPPGGGWVWSSCGQSQDAVIVQDIKVTPDPPRPGQNLTVHAKGIVNSKLEVSKIEDLGRERRERGWFNQKIRVIVSILAE